MRRISGFVVSNYILFLILFVLLIGFSVFSMSWVNVENDVSVYLSDETESKQGNSIMTQEFITYATVDIMVENVTETQADFLVSVLENTKGVLMVTFDKTEAHFKDNAALYNVTFTGPATDPTVIQAYDEIKYSLSLYDFHTYTDSFKDMSAELNEEMSGIILIVAIVVVVILTFTSTTFAEVPVLLITFVAAALINKGTNFLFGTISFVSDSVSLVLQLALSIDYAIIFCNRYKEEHRSKPIREAVRSALTLAVPEISASSLTTVAGLASMTFMQFKLGFDLGICLIKAIVISLFTVFFLMPGLLLLFGNLMDKTRHRSFVPRVQGIGKFAYKARFVIAPLFVLTIIVASLSFTRVNYAYTVDLIESVRKSDSYISHNRIIDRFGENKMLPLMVPAGDYAKEKALIEDLSACDEVNSVLGLASIDAAAGYKLGDLVNYKDFMKIGGVDETTSQALFAYYAAVGDDFKNDPDLVNYEVPLIDIFLAVHEVVESGEAKARGFELPEDQVNLINDLYAQLLMAQDQLQGKNYSRIILYIDLPEQGQETFDFIDRVHAITSKYYPENVYLTGMAVVARDFNETFKTDSNIVSIVSLALVMVILLLTFRSVAMPLLLILVIQGSIWINFATSVWFPSNVYFMWYLIASAIQMGANIDYAIVISSRYHNYRTAGVPRKLAIIESMSLAFPTIITSGGLMATAGLLIGCCVSSADVAGIGMYIGIGTLITLVLVLFALPSLLLIGDSLVMKTTVAMQKKDTQSKAPNKTARAVCCVLLAIAAFSTLVLLPLSKKHTDESLRYTEKKCEEQLDSINELEMLDRELQLAAEKYGEAKMAYAEGYVTEYLGRDQLEEGEAEYEAGKALLDEGEAEYAEAYEKYKAGLEEFETGRTQLIVGEVKYLEGKAEYEAAVEAYNKGYTQYEEGLAQYEAGKIAYEEGLKAYKDGEAAYNAGLAEYNRALGEYNVAKAALDAIGNVYNAVMPAYNSYLDLQRQHQEALDAGRTTEALLLEGSLLIGKATFETSLGSFSSVAELLQSYEQAQQDLAAAELELQAAQQKLADGKAELAAGQAELDAAKAELQAAEAELAAGKLALEDAKAQLEAAKALLDAGEAELNDGRNELIRGEVELMNAKNQLDDARDQLDEGHAQLEGAESELKEGRQRLDENTEMLQGSLESLEVYTASEEKVKHGAELLMSVPDIRKIVGNGASNSEIWNASKTYYTNIAAQVKSEQVVSTWAFLFLILAASCALLTVLLWMLGNHWNATTVFCIISALLCGVGILLWRSFSTANPLLLIPTGILCLVTVASAELLSRLRTPAGKRVKK